MDDWGWQELEPWLERRLELPIGPLFCVITGATGAGPGQPRPLARHTSSATPTLSRWRAKASR